MVSANNAICVPIEPIGRRPQRAKERAHVVIELERREFRQNAAFCRVAGQQQEFQNAGEQHAPRRRVACARKERGQRQRRHHRQIEKDRRRRSTGEAVHHVEHAAVEGHQRDQQQVRKRDPRQRNRQFAACRIVFEPRRENGDHLRHEPPGHEQQDDLRAKQQREDAVGEQPRRGFALAVKMRVGRHERGVEGALGENRAKMIGQPQRHEKRVRHRPRAENGGEHDVARESGQPRKQRITADGEDASEHAPLLAHIRETGKSGRNPFGMILSENRKPTLR